MRIDRRFTDQSNDSANSRNRSMSMMKTTVVSPPPAGQDHLTELEFHRHICGFAAVCALQMFNYRRRVTQMCPRRDLAQGGFSCSRSNGARFVETQHQMSRGQKSEWILSGFTLQGGHFSVQSGNRFALFWGGGGGVLLMMDKAPDSICQDAATFLNCPLCGCQKTKKCLL